jgi:hypothetical protein
MLAQSGSEQPDPLLVVAILTLLAAVAALVPAWVPFLEERPHLVRKLRGPLRSLRRWWRAVLAALVLMLIGYSVFSWPELRLAGLIGALVFLSWLFREALVGWGKRGYVGALWRLVLRPARDRFGVEAARKGDGLSEAYTDRLRAGLGQLSLDSLWVFEGALARRKPGSREAILQYPDGMRLDPPESGAGRAKPRFESALKTLMSVGMISGWEPVGKETVRNFSIKVVLPTADWRTLERLRLAAEVERAKTEMRREMQEELGRRSQPSEAESAWITGVENLDWDELLLLRTLLSRRESGALSSSVEWPRDPVLDGKVTSRREAGVRLTEALNGLRASGHIRKRRFSERADGMSLAVRVDFAVAESAALDDLQMRVDAEMWVRRTEGRDR